MEMLTGMCVYIIFTWFILFPKSFGRHLAIIRNAMNDTASDKE